MARHKARAYELAAVVHDVPIVLRDENARTHVYVQRAEDHVRRMAASTQPITIDTLRNLVSMFLVGDTIVHQSQLLAIASQTRQRVSTLIEGLYTVAGNRVPNPALVKATRADSGTQVQLLVGEASRQMTRVLMDMSARVVIKMYAVMAMSYTHSFEVVHEIVIGHYLTKLVTDYDHVITPHVALVIDWTPGPDIEGIQASETGMPKVVFTDDENEPFNDAEVALATARGVTQYVVAEYADMTLNDYLAQNTYTIEEWTSVQFQLIYSLAVTWLATGFCHNDFHPGNIMLRDTRREPVSPYTNRTWTYIYIDGRTFHIPVTAHGNLFSEIIDMGMARILIKLPEQRDATELWPIHRPQLATIDQSRDVRRIAFALIMMSDIDAAVARNIAREERVRPITDARRAELHRLGDEAKAYLVTAADVRGIMSDVVARLSNIPKPWDDAVNMIAFSFLLHQYAANERRASQYVTLRVTAIYDMIRNVFTQPHLRKAFLDIMPLETIWVNTDKYTGTLLSPEWLLDMPLFAHFQDIHQPVERRGTSSVLVAKMTYGDTRFDPYTGTPLDSDDSSDDDMDVIVIDSSDDDIGAWVVMSSK